MKSINKRVRSWLAASAACALLGFLCGCSISSGDETVREVTVNVEGFYLNSDGSRVVGSNTGSPITTLSITQSGDNITIIDNNGNTYTGSIGSANASSASFSVRGTNAAGNAVTITGTIAVNGATATLAGTWIENALTSTVSGTATLTNNPNAVPANTNTGTGSGTGNGTDTGNNGSGTDGGTDSGGGTDTGGDGGDTGNGGGSNQPPFPPLPQ